MLLNSKQVCQKTALRGAIFCQPWVRCFLFIRNHNRDIHPHIHGNLLVISIVICSWTVHERSWNVREKGVIRDQGGLDNVIRKLSNKQTLFVNCSWTDRRTTNPEHFHNCLEPKTPLSARLYLIFVNSSWKFTNCSLFVYYDLVDDVTCVYGLSFF